MTEKPLPLRILKSMETQGYYHNMRKMVNIFSKRSHPSIWHSFNILRAKTKPRPEIFINREELFNPEHGDLFFLDTMMKYGMIADADSLLLQSAFLAAFGSWRPTQDIIRFDPDVYKELCESEFSGIPETIITRFPAWSLYFETPEGFYDYDGKSLFNGFFVTMDDEKTNRVSFLFIKNSPDNDLNKLEYKGALLTFNPDDRERNFLTAERFREICQNTSDFMSENLKKAMSLLIYVCSFGLEQRKNSTSRFINRKQSGKYENWDVYPAKKPSIRTLGTDFGKKIRNAIKNNETNGHSGYSVRPHLRRAHFHSYWTGPKNGEQELKIRWILPILVGNKKEQEQQNPASSATMC